MNEDENKSTVGQVSIAKVNASVFRENYAGMLGEPAPKKLEDGVRKLEEHLANKAKEKGAPELVQCDICDGWSPEDLESCPYCNDGVEAKLPPPPKLSTAEASSAPAIVSGTAMDRVVTNSDIDVREAGRLFLERVDARPFVESLASMPVSEATLDLATEAFHFCDKAGGKCIAASGRIAKIVKDRLWQQRAGRKDKGFGAWCRNEAGRSERHVNRLIDVAEAFTDEEIVANGSTKLHMMLALPPEQRQELLASGDLAKLPAPSVAEQVAAKLGKPKKKTATPEEQKAKQENTEKLKTEGAAIVAAHKDGSAITVVYANAKTSVNAKGRTSYGLTEIEFTVEGANGTTIEFVLTQQSRRRSTEWRVVQTVRRDDESEAEAAQ